MGKRVTGDDAWGAGRSGKAEMTVRKRSWERSRQGEQKVKTPGTGRRLLHLELQGGRRVQTW